MARLIRGVAQDWASRLQEVAGGLNNTPTEPLMGADPNDVEKQDILEFGRKKQGAGVAEQNQKLTEDRVNKLLNLEASSPRFQPTTSVEGSRPGMGKISSLKTSRTCTGDWR